MTMLALLLAAAPAALPALSPEVQKYVTVSDPVVALTHVRVIDGTGAPARADQTVLLDHGRNARYTAALKKEMAFEHAFAKAGGLLLAGPDPTGNGGTLPGYGDWRELELLVDAGFTPLEAIRVATANGATYLGRQREVGTIAVGLHADLVIVGGDPSTQIADVEKVELVFKDGVGYDPARLFDSVRGTVGAR